MESLKKNKNIIIVGLVIVLLFALIIAVFIKAAQIDKINRNSGNNLNYKFDLHGGNYSKEDLIKFLESAKDCSNYSFEFTEAGRKISGEVYNKKLHYFNGYEDTYYDFTTKHMVIVSDEAKTYRSLNTELDDKYKNILANVALVFFKSDDSNIKFVKTGKYNDFDCIVERVSIDDFDKVKDLDIFTDSQLELLKKYDDQKIKISYEFWIDSLTGLVPKYDIIIESVEKKENRIEYDTNLKVGTVTEDSIKIPEENEYQDYKIIK